MIDMDKINEFITRDIEMFSDSKSQEMFWDNVHISKYMLEAHLNKEWDAASRRHSTISKTCDFISSYIKQDSKIIDLGCGPGLYCTELYDKGYKKITGIDYSKRSINYAKNEAKINDRDIEYIYQDYLSLDTNETYDMAMMIYCDFGVFSTINRRLLLEKIHTILNPNGYFVFDIWSSKHSEHKKEYKSWNILNHGGFWCEQSYIELIDKRFFADNLVSLKQHIILHEYGEIKLYNLWEQLYTIASIKELLNDNGFELIDIYSDLTGLKWDNSSESIGVIAKKI